MGSYYRHTRSEKAEVPYSFQCEHCGKDTGPMRAVIVGPEATDNSNFKTLNPDREQKLCKRAHDNLVNELKSLHKNATEKNIISTKFNDQCPNCHQPQSWAVSGLKNKMFENPLVCLGVGTVFSVIAVLAHFFADNMEYVTLPMAAGIFWIGRGGSCRLSGLECDKDKFKEQKDRQRHAQPSKDRLERGVESAGGAVSLV